MASSNNTPTISPDDVYLVSPLWRMLATIGYPGRYTPDEWRICGVFHAPAIMNLTEVNESGFAITFAIVKERRPWPRFDQFFMSEEPVLKEFGPSFTIECELVRSRVFSR